MKLKHAIFILLVNVLPLGSATAEQYLLIVTGRTAGAYYPIGVLIASVVSKPGKIIATAQASNGSLGNVNGVSSVGIQPG